MKKLLSRIIFFGSLLFCGVDCRAAVVYDLDFTAPDVGSWTIWNGTPVVVDTFGGMSDAVLLHAKTNPRSDGILLNLGAHPLSYDIQFQVMSHGLNDSLFAFTMCMSSTQTHSVGLHGGENANDIAADVQRSPTCASCSQF